MSKRERKPFGERLIASMENGLEVIRDCTDKMQTPPDTVTLPRARYEELLDAERIAWLLARGAIYRDTRLVWKICPTGIGTSWIQVQAVREKEPPVLTDAARAIIDAARKVEEAPRG